VSETIGNPHLKMGVDNSGFETGLKETEAGLGASLTRSQKTAAAGTKRIQEQIDKLNAVKPRQQMFELGQAVQKMGGVFNLSSDQIERLRKQVDALSAAGARVPKNLAGIPKALILPPGLAESLAGKGAGAAAGSLAGQLAPGGALGAGLSAIGPAGIAAAAGIGAIAAAGKAASETIGALVERAGTLTDLSEKTGLSTDALQKLDFVGSQVGVSLDASAGAVLKLQRTLGEAAQGSVKAREAFAAVGISWEELRGLAPEQQFARVAQVLGTIPDQERMVAAGADLMGKGFSEIIPLVKHAHEVLEAPVALDPNTIKQADDLGDAITRLSKAGEELKTKLGISLLSILSTEGDPAHAVDTVTDAVRGLATVVTNPMFQTGLRVLLGVGTMGLSEAAISGVGGLAKVGKKTPEQQGFQGQVDRAHMIADAQKQIATTAALAKDAARGPREKAEKEAARAREALARQEEEQRRKTLASFKALAEEEARFREKTYEREHAAGQKFWDGQVKQAQDSTKRMLSLLQQGVAPHEVQSFGMDVQVLKVNDKLAHLGSTMLSNRNEITKTTSATMDWKEQLEIAAHIIEGMPAGLGKVGSATASIATGIAGIGAAKESFDKASTVKGFAGTLGKASSLLGMAGAAIGIGTAIVGLFKKDPVEQAAKKAGKALGKTISKELAQQFLEESKATGKSIAEVAKKWQAEQDMAAAAAKRKNVEEGLNAARSGFEALLGDIAKLQDTPALQGAIAGIEAKIAEALAKSGLGFMATGALKGSEAFGAAQGAARSGGQVLAGMRQAGMVDAGLQAAMTGLATELQRQAIEAAKAAGLSDQEAAKAGSGAIVDLLREQLNASLASGKELDANTQALIDEARANGIEIIADPMLQQLKVQQQSLTELEQIKGLMAGGGEAFDKFGSFVSGRTFSAQTGLPPAIMPNMGAGVGPLIQTHPGELAMVLPRTQVAGGRRSLARGALPVGNDAFDPRPDPGELAQAAAEAARGPLALNASFPIKFDQSVSFETAQHFARAVAKEARRLFDQADPDVMRAVRRRLGLAT
jgi:hypothetical protein